MTANLNLRNHRVCERGFRKSLRQKKMLYEYKTASTNYTYRVSFDIDWQDLAKCQVYDLWETVK